MSCIEFALQRTEVRNTFVDFATLSGFEGARPRYASCPPRLAGNLTEDDSDLVRNSLDFELDSEGERTPPPPVFDDGLVEHPFPGSPDTDVSEASRKVQLNLRDVLLDGACEQDVGQLRVSEHDAGSSALSLLGSVDVPTIGSLGHLDGSGCKPCAFLERGCSSGADCTFCHLCAPEERKLRRKAKIAYSRPRRTPASF